MNTKTFQLSGIKRFLIVFVLLTLTVSLTPTVSEAAYSTGNPILDQLLTIAQIKLDGEYKALISGKAEDIISTQITLSGKASEKVKEVTDTQLRRNKGLAEHGQKYTKFSSKLSVQKTDVATDNVTLTAQEQITLTLQSDGSKEPIQTQEVKTHVFKFLKQGTTWVLSEDQEVNGIQSAVAEEGLQPITAQPLLLKNTKDVVPNRDKFKDKQASLFLNFLIKSALAASGTYNASNAVTYAYRYWGPNTSNYNTAYRYWDDDCTNFVSQAVNWGGWQHVGGFYTDAHYWWYSPNNIPAWGNKSESWSWVNATRLWYFARYSGRGFNASTLSQFIPGDILQMDKSEANGTNDGVLDHTEIVTKKDNNGNIFLTSHSINVKDKSFWDIYNQWPGAKFYGTLLYSQY